MHVLLEAVADRGHLAHGTTDWPRVATYTNPSTLTSRQLCVVPVVLVIVQWQALGSWGFVLRARPPHSCTSSSSTTTTSTTTMFVFIKHIHECQQHGESSTIVSTTMLH